jgi:hypothetical protein
VSLVPFQISTPRDGCSRGPIAATCSISATSSGTPTARSSEFRRNARCSRPASFRRRVRLIWQKELSLFAGSRSAQIGPHPNQGAFLIRLRLSRRYHRPPLRRDCWRRELIRAAGVSPRVGFTADLAAMEPTDNCGSRPPLCGRAIKILETFAPEALGLGGMSARYLSSTTPVPNISPTIASAAQASGTRSRSSGACSFWYFGMALLYRRNNAVLDA